MENAIQQLLQAAPIVSTSYSSGLYVQPVIEPQQNWKGLPKLEREKRKSNPSLTGSFGDERLKALKRPRLVTERASPHPTTHSEILTTLPPLSSPRPSPIPVDPVSSQADTPTLIPPNPIQACIDQPSITFTSALKHSSEAFSSQSPHAAKSSSQAQAHPTHLEAQILHETTLPASSFLTPPTPVAPISSQADTPTLVPSNPTQPCIDQPIITSTSVSKHSPETTNSHSTKTSSQSQALLGTESLALSSIFNNPFPVVSDFCSQNNIPCPIIQYELVPPEGTLNTLTQFKVWTVVGNEKLEHPKAFTDLEYGRERLAKSVLSRLKTLAGTRTVAHI